MFYVLGDIFGSLENGEHGSVRTSAAGNRNQATIHIRDVPCYVVEVQSHFYGQLIFLC